jgi:hypothetical protein
MGYAIAAYVIVVGALVAYGLRVHQQRRALMRRAAESGDASAAGRSGATSSS